MPNTPQQILKDLQQKKFAPVYFLQGEETFYIDQISDFIEQKAISEADKGFNQAIYYGKDIDMGVVVNSARRFPMMAEKQVVIIKEFQEMADLRKTEALNLLQKYVENPLNSTILVLNYRQKTLDKRTAFYKSIEKQGYLTESNKLYDNKIPDWIETYIKDKNLKINILAVRMLAEHVGNELGRLAKEIDKVCINLKDNEEISQEMIQKFVGISKDYNVFELQKALTEKNVLKSNQIVNYFANNPKENPLIPIVAVLFQYFSKILLYYGTDDKSQGNIAKVLGISPYFVQDFQKATQKYPLPKIIQIIDFLRTADLQSKGVDRGSMEESDILKELVFKILH